MTDQKIMYFESPAVLRKWFLEHGEKKKVLHVGYYKRGTGLASVTWPESIWSAVNIDRVIALTSADRESTRTSNLKLLACP